MANDRPNRLLHPAVATLLGFGLMLTGWPLAWLVSREEFKTAVTIVFVVWAVLLSHFVLFIVRPKVPVIITVQCAAACLLFLISIFSQDPNRAGVYVAHLLGSIGLVAFIWGALRWKEAAPFFNRIAQIIRAQKGIPRSRFGWMMGLLYLSIALAAAWYCFGFLPAYPDSAAQYIHGKFIASGHYFGIDSHPLREFFPVWMMVNDGRWYSQYQPFHQTLLALGHLIGAPWLINPLCAAITLVVLYYMARRHYGETVARIAALLFCVSHMILFISAEFMNHGSALMTATFFLWTYGEMLVRLQRGDRPAACKWAAGAGLSIGMLFLNRPLCAVGIASPFVIYALLLLYKDFRKHAAPMMYMAATGVFCLILQAIYNWGTTGKFWMFPYSKYHLGSAARAMGFFGKEGFSGWGTIRKGWNEWMMMNTHLFDWAVPSLFFVAVICLLPMKRFTRLLVSMLLLYTLVNMANQFNSNIFGPRYIYETTSALVLLTALGIRNMRFVYKRAGVSLPAAQTVNGIMAVAVIGLLFTGYAYRFPASLKKYSEGYIDSRPRFYASMLEQSEKPALIFIGRFAKFDNPPKDQTVIKYRWIAHTNPPRDDAPVIFAIDRGDKANRRLMNYYSNRKAYVEYKGKLIPAEAAAAGPIAK